MHDRAVTSPIPPEGKRPHLERGGFRQPSGSTAPPPHKVREAWPASRGHLGGQNQGCGARGAHAAGKTPPPDPVSHPSLADPGLALAGLHATSAPAQSFPRPDKPGQRGEKSVLSLGTTGAPVAQGSCQLARPCPSQDPRQLPLACRVRCHPEPRGMTSPFTPVQGP